MKIPQMVVTEFRRLTRSPMAILALLALGIVPLLYGGLYLWANQNPYGKLNEIPVALVVEDTGAEGPSGFTNYGEQIADELVKDGTFAWHEVSAAEAQAGVDDSSFDFSVTIPADFSEQLVSSSGSEPQQATVILTTNDANGYLASTIGETAIKEIQRQIVATVNEQAATQFLGALATIRSNLVTAVDGAGKLVAGAAEAQAGATALASGTEQLATGSAALRDGLGTLAGGAAALPDAASRLATGAGQVAAGNAEIARIGDEIGAVTQGVVNDLPAVRADIAARLSAAGLSEAEVAAALAALDQIGARIGDGNARVQDAVGKLDLLASGSAELAVGTGELAEQAPALAQGAQEAANGSAALADGAGQAASGSAALSAGLDTLHGGLESLAGGLSGGVEQIPESTEQSRQNQAQTIANPVAIDTSQVAAAGTYGAGLAPFFIALAAWIGIYALFLIVKPVSNRAITALHSPMKITVAGWLTPALIGTLQMAGLFFVVAVALGFNFSNPLASYGIMALSSMVFTAIILALNVWLGSVGQFIGLVMMVLQLVSAGGTFPWQTLPGPLAGLHHVLPMSFTVDAIRQLMYGGDVSRAWADLGVLATWGAIAFVLAALGVARMTHFRTLRDLEPSLIG
ncbi:YhgE/Pip family protein [Microterricola viridarii]|uniref:Putative membrane protein n=1 Tax=Microterricola viridarii TaxID=412690 RepID=A0A1H1NIP7_9MICO|nr:YhgE/Pip family protein [Microterricola viridarii]SDR98199.1 putative membrane protein [Microterricola viridarii]